MKYLFCLFLIVGLNFSVLNSAKKDNLVKGSIIARNSYDETVYIPKEWGGLKGITTHGEFDILYFESSDGVIYAVKLYVSKDGNLAFSPGGSNFDDFVTNNTDINASKILRK